jgi:hypothetical protein
LKIREKYLFEATNGPDYARRARCTIVTEVVMAFISEAAAI